ncbi:hypothetical protein [Nereida sp. MMG025]|uniref:hypothetical protein n=1 Tax=Nereida sp. MMG025 TaxID=2909981 RepID=UPI001F162AB1|nr:hypothetical protein [Nereida sp. MMG025]MCF6445082.1 hypothetical protein [Nereida sp. MMG025]
MRRFLISVAMVCGLAACQVGTTATTPLPPVDQRKVPQNPQQAMDFIGQVMENGGCRMSFLQLGRASRLPGGANAWDNFWGQGAQHSTPNGGYLADAIRILNDRGSLLFGKAAGGHPANRTLIYQSGGCYKGPAGAKPFASEAAAAAYVAAKFEAAGCRLHIKDLGVQVAGDGHANVFTPAFFRPVIGFSNNRLERYYDTREKMQLGFAIDRLVQSRQLRALDGRKYGRWQYRGGACAR